MKQFEKHLINLIKAAFENDREIIEMSTLSVIRTLKNEKPEVAIKISEILSNYRAGASLTRANGQLPPPKDKDSLNSLVKIENTTITPSDIFLSQEAKATVFDFLLTREHTKELLEFGIKPNNSILLYGEPGVGKTYLAKYLASQTELPLLTLDLSTTISSFLGKTGKNIKEALDYAKQSPSILLLDEFDAIGKRRTDSSELGELKRIVNVLLKELETWPHDCILVAATNHPELLDDAIWRRFNLKIEVGVPEKELRYDLWNFYLNRGVVTVENNFLNFLSNTFEGMTPADIEQVCNTALQKQIVSGGDIRVNTLSSFSKTKIEISNVSKKKLVKSIKTEYKNLLTQREISDLTGVSLASVNRYLKEEEN